MIAVKAAQGTKEMCKASQNGRSKEHSCQQLKGAQSSYSEALLLLHNSMFAVIEQNDIIHTGTQAMPSSNFRVGDCII